MYRPKEQPTESCIMAEMKQGCDTDPFVFVRKELDVSASERAKFQAQLQNIPHTFQILEELRPTQLKRVQLCLESALSEGFDTQLETARTKNLLAYLLYQQHHPDEALQQLDEVLKMDGHSDNLVTLANKSVILYHRHQVSDAQALVERLHHIKTTREGDYPSLVLKATAELAFSYTRFGPSCYPLAVETFEQVILEAGDIPEKWLWKFGLGLIRRRLLSLNPGVTLKAFNPDEERAVLDLLSLFLEIIQNCESEGLKANAYAQMAFVLDTVRAMKELYSKCCATCEMDVEQACKNAVHYNKNHDNSVLVVCGKIYRNLKKYTDSRNVLEMALSKRETSNCFHHLGITYKKLAAVAQEDDLHASIGQQEPERQGEHRYDRCAPNVDNLTPPEEMKSPPNNTARFSIDDKYIKETIYNFKQAIAVSEGENLDALYDLAQMYKALGQLDHAKSYLLKILHCKTYVAGILRVHVYEQMGLITKEMAESAKDLEEKRKLEMDSSHHFHMALLTAAQLSTKSHNVKEYVQGNLDSFACLLQQIDTSGNNEPRKLRDKAILFNLIKDNERSIEILKRIREMDPSEENNPQHLKLCIENYVETKQYLKALAFVELLECICQTGQAKSLFGEEHFVQKIRMRVAQEMLMQEFPNPEARPHFRDVFKDSFTTPQAEPSSSEDTDASEGSAATKGLYDIVLLYEESDMAKAVDLTEIIESVYGLNVAISDRDVPGNKLALEGAMKLVSQSTLVVVLARHKKISTELRFLIDRAARKGRRFVITILAEGIHVPKMLKTHRSTQDVFKSNDVSSVLRLFCFLVDMDLNF